MLATHSARVLSTPPTPRSLNPPIGDKLPHVVSAHSVQKLQPLIELLEVKGRLDLTFKVIDFSHDVSTQLLH